MSEQAMGEYGIVTEAGAVRFERLLPGPIERVWAYLTDPDKRGTWLAAGPMELRVGGQVELNFHHADLSAEKTPPDRYKKLEGGHTTARPCHALRAASPAELHLGGMGRSHLRAHSAR